MIVRSRHFYFLFLLVIAGFPTEPLRAQNVSQPQNTGPSDASIAALLPQNGDPTGLRKWLEQHGTTFTVFYTNDVLGNLSGGIKRGTIDQGKVELQVTTDLDKVAGLKDLTLYWNAFQVHNTGRIRRDYAGGMNTIAAIEAAPATRLSELWLETTRLQNTHGTEEREVLYPWHPWVGCIVQIHKVVEKASGNVARCSREGAAVCRALELPTWMFDRAACAPMRMDARPRVIPRYDLDQS